MRSAVTQTTRRGSHNGQQNQYQQHRHCADKPLGSVIIVAVVVFRRRRRGTCSLGFALAVAASFARRTLRLVSSWHAHLFGGLTVVILIVIAAAAVIRRQVLAALEGADVTAAGTERVPGAGNGGTIVITLPARNGSCGATVFVFVVAAIAVFAQMDTNGEAKTGRVIVVLLVAFAFGRGVDGQLHRLAPLHGVHAALFFG